MIGCVTQTIIRETWDMRLNSQTLYCYWGLALIYRGLIWLRKNVDSKQDCPHMLLFCIVASRPLAHGSRVVLQKSGSRTSAKGD